MDRNDEITYLVITDGSGPLRDGELLVCAKIPGGGAREIGGRGRNPSKWDCEYEQFSDIWPAIELATDRRPASGIPISMKEIPPDVNAEKVIEDVRAQDS